MAKIHDLFIVELAEVIKGYGNNPDDKDPFRISEFYRFYELPNIAVSRENFEKMRPFEPERKKGKWMHDGHHIRCTECGVYVCETDREGDAIPRNYCPSCGADMREEGGE